MKLIPGGDKREMVLLIARDISLPERSPQVWFLYLTDPSAGNDEVVVGCDVAHLLTEVDERREEKVSVYLTLFTLHSVT